MQIRTIAFSLAVIALASIASARSSDEQQIRSLYPEMISAVKSKNIQVIDSLETPDYTEVTGHKTITKQQDDQQMQQLFKLLTKINSMDVKILSVSTSGKVAHVKTSFHLDAIFTDQSGKKHIIKESGTTTDTVVKTAKGWKFKSEVHTSNKGTLDGKPVPTG